MDHTEDNWHRPITSVRFSLGGHSLWTSPQLPLQKKAFGIMGGQIGRYTEAHQRCVFHPFKLCTTSSSSKFKYEQACYS